MCMARVQNYIYHDGMRGPTAADNNGDRPRTELDLGWALDRYMHQECACHYTGGTLAVSGPIYTTPFVLSFIHFSPTGCTSRRTEGVAINVLHHELGTDSATMSYIVVRVVPALSLSVRRGGTDSLPAPRCGTS